MSEHDHVLPVRRKARTRPKVALESGLARVLSRAKRHAQNRWDFLLLVELANYSTLRRYVGISRSETLTEQLALLVSELVDNGYARVVGRNLVEVRFGGSSRDLLDEALARIERAFAVSVDVDGESFTLDVTLGGAAVPASECDSIKLIEVAEQALADARTNHTVVTRQISLGSSSIDYHVFARDLRDAIEAEQFFLQYQPKINIRRKGVSGVEALIRWRHPERGLVLPSDFIPIAEQTRDIGALTLWTIRQVIADQRRLTAVGYRLPFFVNIAGMLLSDARFVRQACSLIEGSDASLGFEITETSVIRDPESAIAHLNAFANIGITIAIDDYGAGLSSLAYLKQLPARELKIDKMFVTNLTSSNRDPLIVRSTIDLAHALEMEVVAEGVESRAALALLAVMGCDMAQGFLISRPLMWDGLLSFLTSGQHLQAYDLKIPFVGNPTTQAG